ncbi:MAG: hypothetical protein ACI9Z9_002681, partial [Litorivivens sp.]
NYALQDKLAIRNYFLLDETQHARNALLMRAD